MTTLTAQVGSDAAPELSQVEYHELRAAGGLFQRCRACGRCEVAGGYCSWCRNAEYVLDAHVHPGKGQSRVCPLAGRSVYGSVAQAVLRGTYHHVPGASARRFRVAAPSDARLAGPARARGRSAGPAGAVVAT